MRTKSVSRVASKIMTLHVVDLGFVVVALPFWHISS